MFKGNWSAWAWGLVFGLTSIVGPTTSHAAERIRFYEFGENDPGAMLGAVTFETLDSQVPPSPDLAGGADFVPLIAEVFGDEPRYVEGRGGAGTFALEFDGMFNRMTSPALDPRNFGGSFATLSQAWLKPDSAKQGQQQYVWSLGNDNGGVGITADGFWQIVASSIAPDTASSVPVAFDEWTHVAVRRTGNNAFLFVNGELVTTADGFWNGTGNVTVGNRTSEDPNTSTANYHGAIDDFVLSAGGAFNPGQDLTFFTDLVLSGVPGDVDQDGVVDQNDYNIWSLNVGFNNGLGSGDPSTLLRGDLDQNGRVNFFDFHQIVLGAQAQQNSLPAGVPEPSTLLLCVLAVACAAGWRLRGALAKRVVCGAAVLGAIAVLTGPATAAVVVAEDFFYLQPTKVLGPGGGFTLQDYGGGQNGPAGQWNGRWVSIGNAIITSADHMPEEEQFQALVTTGLSLAEMNRNYSFNGLANDQTLYFGIRMRTGDVDVMPDARFNINPVETNSAVGIGFSQGTFVAQLGEETALGFNVTNDAEYHSLIGKLEFNAVGNQERLTVWLNPTGVEMGADSTTLTHDVVGGLNDFAGNLELYLDVEGGSAIWWDDLAVGTTWDDVASVNVPRLSMRINSDTGAASLLNQTGQAYAFNFLELSSESNSLSVSGWNSLADQNVEGGAWQENNPTARLLTESNFTGSTLLPDGGSLSLGRPFASGGMQDIVAHVGNAQGLFNLILIEYVTGGGIPGDYNNSGQVEQADLDLVLLNWGQPTPPVPAGWTNDLPVGAIDQEELDKVLLNWGNTAAAGGLAASSVPEPGSFAVAALACLTVLGVIKRR